MFASSDKVTDSLAVQALRLLPLSLLLCLALTACSLEALLPPTATLTPSNTPVPPTVTNTATATFTLPPTATPTFTATPTATATATDSPTPTVTPTVFGIVSSQRRANVRRGPGTNFPVFNALEPGIGLQILGTSEDEGWYNVRLQNGAEGWISVSLLAIETAPETVPPAESDPITISSETRVVVEVAALEADETESAEDGILVFNVQIADVDSMNLTATVLIAATTAAAPPLPTAVATETEPPTATPAGPTAPPRLDVNVFAFCDDASFGIPAPSDLPPGSTIKIYWAWFASTQAYLREHMSNATHELRVNGEAIPNVNRYRGNPRTSGSQHVVYWYVPYGPLAAGEHRITYRVTWTNAISDGYANYGPGTAIEFEEESCTIDVR